MVLLAAPVQVDADGDDVVDEKQNSTVALPPPALTDPLSCADVALTFDATELVEVTPATFVVKFSTADVAEPLAFVATTT
jgi:hypothetical protein